MILPEVGDAELGVLAIDVGAVNAVELLFEVDIGGGGGGGDCVSDSGPDMCIPSA